MRETPSVDATVLKRRLLTLLFVVGAIFLSFSAIKSGNPAMIAAVFALPLATWMMKNPSWVLVLLYLAGYAQFVLPGLPGDISLLMLTQIAIVGIIALQKAMKTEPRKKNEPSRVWIILFLLNMLLIIAVRGFGLTILGSAAYGGKKYIILLVVFLFFFAAPKISISEKHVNYLFFGGLVATLLPVLAQVSLFMSGGATQAWAAFFSISWRDVEQAMIMGGESGDVRWSMLRHFGAMIITVSLVWPPLWKRKILAWILIGLAVYLTMLSGFRSRIVEAGALIFIWLIVTAKNKMRRFMVLLFLGLIGWGVALAIIPLLPFHGQRALSFLPLAAERITDPMAIKEAQDSIDFRVEIWGIAWENIHEYLFIGRGLLLQVAEWAWLQRGAYGTPEFFYAGHAYHSGPLSLLIDFGIFGFVVGTGFLLSLCVEAWRGVRKYCSGKTDLLSRYYTFMAIFLSYRVFAFYFIYGNVTKNFPEMIMTAVLLKVLLNEIKSRKSDYLKPIEADEIDVVEGD